MRRKYDDRALRRLGHIFDGKSTLLFQLRHDMPVVDDLMLHIHGPARRNYAVGVVGGRAEQREGVFYRFDRPGHPGAEPPGTG